MSSSAMNSARALAMVSALKRQILEPSSCSNG